MGEAKDTKSKSRTVIVNGQQKEVEDKDISFEELVALAFDPVPTGPDVGFTVSYAKGPDSRKEGTLVPGQTVKAKDAIVFDVTATNKS